MQERTKAQLTIGFLAFFASMWIFFQEVMNNTDLLYVFGLLVLLLIVMLIISYVMIAILEWIGIFDLKTNAVLTLVVLATFMITLTMYILVNNTS